MRVYAAVEAIGGSISAETGIGFAKKGIPGPQQITRRDGVDAGTEEHGRSQHILNRGRIFD